MEEKLGEEEARPVGTKESTGESGELLLFESLGDCERM